MSKGRWIRGTEYVNDTDLFYQTKLSQGKGYMTKELQDMLILINTNFMYRLRSRYIGRENDIQDATQTSLYYMFKNYMNFNSKKYYKALPYWTEICKRGATMGFNEINDWQKGPLTHSIHEYMI